MLARKHIELLLEALRYTRQAFEQYPYPSAELRAARLQAVDDAMAELRAMRRTTKQEAKTT